MCEKMGIMGVNGEMCERVGIVGEDGEVWGKQRTMRKMGIVREAQN